MNPLIRERPLTHTTSGVIYPSLGLIISNTLYTLGSSLYH